jgi:hypothetical protein
MAKKAQFTPTIVSTVNERRLAADKIIAEAAKKYGNGYVERSEKMNSSYLLRRPTGIVSIDIAMAGGWPAAAPSVLVGPDGAGKDYLLWRTAAETQKLYGEEFCMACYFTEFKPDKLFMKDMCGFQIAFTEDEIEELDMARRKMGKPTLTSHDQDHYRHQVGTFIPILGLSADHGFDEVFKFLDANICQIVAVNSIGSMQTEAKENTDSFEEFPQQRNEASLLSKVMPKFSMYLNRSDNDKPNETSLILVNQVRSKDAAQRPMKGRVPQEKDGYKTASNAWALKHHKAIELFVHNGPRIYDEEAKPPLPLGRKKQWELTKGKLGTHEGIKGEFDFFFGEGADILGDLVTTSLKLDIVQANGSWMTYDADGFKFKTQGAARVLELLRKQPELVAHLRERCFQEAGFLCRHR